MDRSDLVSGAVGCADAVRKGDAPVGVSALLGVTDDNPVEPDAPSESGASDLGAVPVLAVRSSSPDEVGVADEVFFASWSSSGAPSSGKYPRISQW